MIGREEVDVDKAVSVGDSLGGTGTGAGSSGGGGNATEEVEKNARIVAQEILLTLPGINTHNFREVMDKVESVAALSKMSEQQLAPIVGPGNAKKLCAFFRRRTLN
jgi:hypothetical protein